MNTPTATSEAADVPRIVIIGSDAALGVRPNTPVQLAHACLLAGYSFAVPATWGDELVASECVRQLVDQPRGTMVLCSCPLVRRRLLGRGAELAPFMVSLVSPPVAAARYLRAVAGQSISVHFVGRCSSAQDESIDRWIDPDDFMDTLESQGIDITAQPTSFEGILPPDRRRHWSLAGGFPDPDQLWEGGGRRRRVEPGPDEDLADAVVEHLLSSEPSLLDLAPSLQCACAGVVTGVPPRTARARVALTEPPRSPSAVVDHSVEISLTIPIDVASVPVAASGEASLSSRYSSAFLPDPAAATKLAPENPPLKRRHSGASTVRPSPTSVPVSRQSDGKLVPRAYAAKRRITPATGSAIPVVPSMSSASDDVDDHPVRDELARQVARLEAELLGREPRLSPVLGVAAQSAD